jgi:ankyrin repeat protein
VGLTADALLLAQPADGNTAYHLAVKNNHVQTLKQLWVWAEEMQHNHNELKKRMYL